MDLPQNVFFFFFVSFVGNKLFWLNALDVYPFIFLTHSEVVLAEWQVSTTQCAWENNSYTKYTVRLVLQGSEITTQDTCIFQKEKRKRLHFIDIKLDCMFWVCYSLYIQFLVRVIVWSGAVTRAMNFRSSSIKFSMLRFVYRAVWWLWFRAPTPSSKNICFVHSQNDVDRFVGM